MFCDAPDYSMLESGAAMSRSDDDINVGMTGCGTNFVDRETRETFGLNGQVAQKFHLFERVHFLPCGFLHRFGQP